MITREELSETGHQILEIVSPRGSTSISLVESEMDRRAGKGQSVVSDEIKKLALTGLIRRNDPTAGYLRITPLGEKIVKVTKSAFK